MLNMLSAASSFPMRISAMALASAVVVLACAATDSTQGGPGDGSAPTSASAGDASSSDGAIQVGDAAAPSDAGPPVTCSQKLANPTASGTCLSSDEAKSCSQGCLKCACSGGRWQPCTTDPSCFGG